MAVVDSDFSASEDGGRAARSAGGQAGTASARRDDVQGLRALAVAMVVACHARLPLPGGFAGVDVFFVISGFVITAMLLREWRASGRIDLAHFYVRRSLRLLPALALVVAFVMLATLVAPSPFDSDGTTARTGIGALCFVANLVIARAAGDYFAEAAAENPLLHTWSLSLEEQFYLVFPVSLLGVLALGRGLGRPMLVPAAALALATAASFGLSIAWVDGSSFAAGLTDPFGGPAVFAFYGLPSRVWELGVGGLVAFAAARGLETSRIFREGIGVFGLALIVGSALLLDGSAGFPGWLAVLPVAGTAMVLVAGSSSVSGSGAMVSRLLSTRPLVAIGDVSYSLYLWHWPLIVIAGQAFPERSSAPVAAALLAVLPAWLSHGALEQPLRAWRPRAIATVVPVLVSVAALPIALAGGVIAVEDSRGSEGIARDDDERPHRLAARHRNPRAWRNAHVVVAAGCINHPLDSVHCRFGPSPSKGTILLLGDSSAYAVGDGLIPAANELGYDVVVSSIEGCPFLQRRSTERRHPECPSWQRRTLGYALATHPAAVVIANRSAGYVHPDGGWLTVVDEQGHRAQTIEEATAIWQRGLEETVLPLRDAGIPVLLVASVAEMPSTATRRTILAQAYGGASIGVPLSEVLAHRRPAFEVERAVAARHPHAAVFDPLTTLCRPICASAAGGTILYQDKTHLSVDGALLLVPGLRASLEAVLRPDRARPMPPMSRAPAASAANPVGSGTG